MASPTPSGLRRSSKPARLKSFALRDVAPPLKSPVQLSARSPVKATYGMASLGQSTANHTQPAQEDLSRLPPDEMFVRFTVPEVRALQSRLRCCPLSPEIYIHIPNVLVYLLCLRRSDADSKQEELRVMVGCVPLRDTCANGLMTNADESAANVTVISCKHRLPSNLSPNHRNECETPLRI